MKPKLQLLPPLALAPATARELARPDPGDLDGLYRRYAPYVAAVAIRGCVAIARAPDQLCPGRQALRLATACPLLNSHTEPSVAAVRASWRSALLNSGMQRW